MKDYYVYILASQKNGTLYIGVANNLLERVSQHKKKTSEGFTEKYSVSMLVYYERRQWKINLIESINPNWQDLYFELGGV